MGYADTVNDLRTNARGQLSRLTHGNGVVTAREHDSDLERLVRIYSSHDDGTLTEFQDLSYAYDPVGNPVAITDNLASSSYKANTIIPNTRAFEYDPRYRLIRATGKKHASVVPRADDIEVPSPDPNDYDAYDYTYSYDPVGNLTRNDEYASSLYYKSGRIDLFNGDSTEAGSFTDPATGNFRYDDNGNTLKTPRLEALAYTHDDQCRWVKLNSGGDAVRYFRHADQRVLRFVKKGQVQALSVYLGPFEYHSRDGGSGGTTYGKLVLHVHGHGRHAQVENVLSGSDPDSLDVFYHHGDHLGSGHVLTKDDATLMSQEEYFPYGRSSDRRDARNRYRFIGVERDEDTGMCMTGPRQYDPVMGRFLEGDPIGANSAGGTPFVYARAMPTQLLDPGGYQEEAAQQAPGTVAPESATPVSVAPGEGPLLHPLTGPPGSPVVSAAVVVISTGDSILDEPRRAYAQEQFDSARAIFAENGVTLTMQGEMVMLHEDVLEDPGTFSVDRRWGGLTSSPDVAATHQAVQGAGLTPDLTLVVGVESITKFGVRDPGLGGFNVPGEGISLVTASGINKSRATSGHELAHQMGVVDHSSEGSLANPNLMQSGIHRFDHPDLPVRLSPQEQEIFRRRASEMDRR